MNTIYVNNIKRVKNMKRKDMKERKEFYGNLFEGSGVNMNKDDFVHFFTEENRKNDFTDLQMEFGKPGLCGKTRRELDTIFEVKRPSAMDFIDPMKKFDMVRKDSFEAQENELEAGHMGAHTPNDENKYEDRNSIHLQGLPEHMAARYVRLEENTSFHNEEVQEAASKHIDFVKPKEEYVGSGNISVAREDFSNEPSMTDVLINELGLGDNRFDMDDLGKKEELEEVEEDDSSEAEMEAETPEVKKKSKKKTKRNNTSEKPKEKTKFQKATTEDMTQAGLPVKYQVFIESQYGKGDFYLDPESKEGLYKTEKGGIVDFRLIKKTTIAEDPKEIIPTEDMGNSDGELLKRVKGLNS